ncbi:sensor histidine kinase [Archangium sp.]|uniref:sensor histidine kinase n=1 Tax=Archangium sp. TaxID=1872627 RepID=UPI002D240C2A|nr:ATP-binding protein [Archangium sp.]HYO59841.1 ATP-binding protein [Archangium sp.]
MNETEAQKEKVDILLVDDRPGNLLSLKGILERPDYNLISALSGEEALNLILRQDFAVILLDVAMPGMDGFEVASTIKQRERFKNIPIIFVTASVHHIEWIFKAYSVGAVDFLHKPLDPHAVRAKVAVFVELYRQKQQLKHHAATIQRFERRERELEVARLRIESDRRYRHLAEAIPHVVWTASAEGELEYFNQRWFEITGVDEKSSLGSGWSSALHPEDVEKFAAQWESALQTGKAFQMEFRLRKADGSYCWYRNRALPEEDASSRVVRWVGTMTDVDEEKRAHEELHGAIRLRDEFMSVASHELRTPLSALQLQLQSLQRLLQKVGAEILEGRITEKLGTAVRQTERLAKLIDSLLDVSRIARGKLELQLENFDLADAVREVAERFRDEAAREGCELNISSQPVTGRWDRLRIEQVITNLVSNSLKYGPGKPITLSVAPLGEGLATITVEDEGIGIEPDKVKRIFNRFERAVPTRHYGGLGLGLYIVRQIVQEHRGQVEVESRPGAGSRFVVTLPRRPSEAREQSHVPEATEHADGHAG